MQHYLTHYPVNLSKKVSIITENVLSSFLVLKKGVFYNKGNDIFNKSQDYPEVRIK